MLSPQSWLPFAEGLDIGRKRRVDHDCGGGKTLIVSRDERGYSAYCWRCNEPGASAGPRESLSDKLARMARFREADSVCASIQGKPEPAIYDVDSWPDQAKLWLYKAGLSRGDIGAIGAYYHEPSGRVVLPVLAGGLLSYWQARALDGRNPKYIGQTPRPPDLVAKWGSAEDITLCEDILSAYKVGLVAEGWALMGTSIPAAYIAALMRRRARVNVWLDPDRAGRKAATRYVKQLTAYGLEVRNIQSTKDPKLHSRDEIRKQLM